MSQDVLYQEAANVYGAALERLAGSYEADRDKRLDLLQDIHLAIWRSFEVFAGHCSMRTWVYRVAHNVAATHVIRHRRVSSRPLVSLDEVDDLPAGGDSEGAFDLQQSLGLLREFIQQLNPLERQVILLYLEGTDAAGIAEITGISPGNVATKIHRIKKILAGRFNTRFKGERHGQ
ncbi:MAG TPA: RNA polymerase sigma factor [Thermoanaerobaculia bacterium]|jgi:RNA polymerase sigma-70 factor (ECF subfamily)|nr:RNA polymerase sigma factor [Thermoanaerobaculia bacterium]